MNQQDVIKKIQANRQAIRESWPQLRTVETDRDKNLPQPKLFRPLDESLQQVPLETDFSSIPQKTLHEVIHSRRSLRQYRDLPLTKAEVSYLLYETSSVKDIRGTATFRTIPTGGARNGMETYVYIHAVDGIKRGLYHYQQTTHTLQLLDDKNDIDERVNEALYRQLRDASIVVIFTAVPYRSEYKYSFCAHKMLAMEAGHAGQNLSLAAEVIDSGACCLAAYKQDELDLLLDLDIDKEFATYAITIGKK